LEDISGVEILYKYVPVRRQDYLEEDYQLLRFTQPAALNDPSECLPGLRLDQAQETLKLHSEQRRACNSRVEKTEFGKKRRP